MDNFIVGSLVSYRDRNWILIDRDTQTQRLLLRPLTGGDDYAIPVSLKLSSALRGVFPYEIPAPSSFPVPSSDKRASYTDFHLFLLGSQLSLKDGAAPIRSLGRISIKPRTYQLVPLLMALRLDPVRLLIADDVGVGKTIEAGLIARELLDRKLARRLAVIAPPHLLEQWAFELSTKFALDPVVISAGTIGRLERKLPVNKSVYEAYSAQVISIDFVKHPRHRSLFLHGAPDLVIIDEAHGVVGGKTASSHQRYELAKELAQNSSRHILLLTATPHSGIPESFGRLLGLLNPEFENWDLVNLSEQERSRLAEHFIQRTRLDIARHWGDENLFPKRKTVTAEYKLSQEYLELYNETYAYAKEIVDSSAVLSNEKRRMRWWAALSLLRSIMSSPKSALTAIESRLSKYEELSGEELDAFAPQVYEASELPPDDEVPSPLIQAVEKYNPSKLRRLKALTESITASKDYKIQALLELVGDLLSKDHNPVIWCHFVDTAQYVYKQIQDRFPNVEVAVVTGRIDGEERRDAVEALMEKSPRILVATDCVSEGINLQEGFSSVVHYDLPWNPNRLEQREGRVDRYGQTRNEVVAVRYLGIDNPMDQKVIDVLLRKADEIRQALGTYMPIFNEEKYVIDQMTIELFSKRGHQLALLTESGPSEFVEEEWSIDKARKRVGRTRFSQRTIRPEEVLDTLRETDAVFGGEEKVKNFVLSAMQRLNAKIRPIPADTGTGGPEAWEFFVDADELPGVLKTTMGHYFTDKQGKPKALRVSFTDPAPPNTVSMGRAHPLVTTLARYFFEGALLGQVGRWGAWKTDVERAVYLYLLRPRYLTAERNKEYLAEEVLLVGIQGDRLLSDTEARALLDKEPGDIDDEEASELFRLALKRYNKHEEAIHALVKRRAEEVLQSTRKLRQASKDRVGAIKTQAVLPPDLLGVLILQPE